ncbi:MAG TPA: glycoside hydrolase family 31 protein, partial [Rhizomicrobium sp.]|nr:glycoside hydrolase family 31 protein [Rhizomicrobium sp.]
IATAQIRLGIKLRGFLCTWETRHGAEWTTAARDRRTQAYNFGWWDDRIYHYLARELYEKYFGLGERSGDMDRAGRRFRMTGTDAMGYSARTSDPLYKHIPFYITHRPGATFGLFYDTLADCTFDMGCERSNYHGLYRSFVAERGDLDYYFIAGADTAAVTRRFTGLTGRPAFLPRWSLGYSGSTMSYTDAPDAQARMNEFLEKCETHDILCDSFHLSSGYTSIGNKRYVFHWNREKFPDPTAFVARFRERGVRLVPNVKPCLLRDHPLFAEARAQGILVCDGNGEPDWVQFWDDIGAYVDFTNPRAIAWWKERVDASLLVHGMAGTWNDNNEYEIVSPRARINGFGEARAGMEAKPLQSLLMMRASRDAQHARAPDKRPFLVTRAGAVGLHRYAQTWSGDNATSWETLKYNLKMGLGLALSGVSNTGHDIGGFAGRAPDAELFLRWVQAGIFMPRFSIHSWNDDGTVNEPWMHPEITPQVRDLIKFRYRLMPYFYDLSWKYHRHFAPMVRPTFYDFPDDPRCYDENDEMMLGPALLVAPVVEPGRDTRTVYLPRGADWYDFWTGRIFAGGDSVTLPAPPTQPALLARAGSMVAINRAEQHFAAPADARGFQIFPHRDRGTFVATSFEDDGDSDGYLRGAFREWTFTIDCGDRIHIGLAQAGALARYDETVHLILPASETRKLELSGAQVIGESRSPEGHVIVASLDPSVIAPGKA